MESVIMATSTYDFISGTLLGSSTNLVTFTSIPSTYTDLVITIGTMVSSSTNSAMVMYFNNDTSSSYNYIGWNANGSPSGQASYAGTQSLGNTGPANKINVNSTSSTYSAQYNIRIARYADTTVYKTSLCTMGSGQVGIEYFTNTWRSTSAINRVDFQLQSGYTMGSGTRITLWGIKAE